MANMSKHTADYEIRMRDGSGRVVALSITGATIDEMTRDGYSHSQAVESVESNAFQNAIARGEIGPDAYIIAEKVECGSGHKHLSSALADRCNQVRKARAAKANKGAA